MASSAVRGCVGASAAHGRAQGLAGEAQRQGSVRADPGLGNRGGYSAVTQPCRGRCQGAGRMLLRTHFGRATLGGSP